MVPAMKNLVEYRAWYSMRQRCNNPRDTKYRIYGARGIKVCARWQKSFQDFLEDMGPRPDGFSLDRYPDKDGNYEPGNCRWASVIEQNNNKRTNRLVQIHGAWLTMAAAARAYGVDYKLFRDRIKRGWSPDEAINEPAAVKEGFGVCFIQNRNKWRADIRIAGKTHYIGLFLQKEEAMAAFQEAVLRWRSSAHAQTGPADESTDAMAGM